MGVFSALFGRFRPKTKLYFGLGGSSPGWNRDVYEQETVRAIIDCIASHAAKAEAMHVILDRNGRVKEIKRNSPYVKLLNQRPNSLMSGFDLKYKLVAQLEDKTTALAYIKWEGPEGTTPTAIIPISYQQFTFGRIDGGGYAVRFDSPTVLFEYSGTEYKEQIDRHAFDGALMEDVIFNYNHGGKVLARTRNDTFEGYKQDLTLYCSRRARQT